MRWHYLTNTIIVILVILIAVLIVNKPTSNLTELYFTDYTKLQKFSDGNFEVVYTIHNLENKDMSYETKVIVKEGDIVLGDFCNELVYLKNGAYTTKVCRFKIDKFENVKVKVLLVNKEQEIHFWSEYVKKPFYYDDYGYGDLSCLKLNNVSNGLIILNAKGDYVKEWPIVDLYVDGKKKDTRTISSGYFKDYVFNYRLTSGEHVVDIVYVNDYYDPKTKADMNVYINNVYVGDSKINNFVVDNPQNAFDCKELDDDVALFSLSSFRFKVLVR